MKGMIVFAAASLIAGSALAGQAERNASPPTGTVNSYTAAELRRAEAAAQRQGFKPVGGVWAQAGTIFMNAEKGGARHQLTITSDGVVHVGQAVPPAQPANNS